MIFDRGGFSLAKNLSNGLKVRWWVEPCRSVESVEWVGVSV